MGRSHLGLEPIVLVHVTALSVFEGRLGSCAEHVFALTPSVACLPLSISNRECGRRQCTQLEAV